MTAGFPPQPLYPLAFDSDRTLFEVFNTSETITVRDNMPWAEEIEILPVPSDEAEIWGDNGFANISGELFYYDSVEKNVSGRIFKLKRCARNLGGKRTQYNPAGSFVRGFVVAEHHNQLATAIIEVEKFLKSLEADAIDLQDIPVCQDDAKCPNVEFNFQVINSTNPCEGQTAVYNISIDGGFSGFSLDFGDGTTTSSQQTGTHTYPPNSKIDPIVTVTNENCTVVQTPIARNNPRLINTPSATIPFTVATPVFPDIPTITIPGCQSPDITFQFPPFVSNCVEVGPLGPINIPSVIMVRPPINIPSVIRFTNVPSFSPISFTNVPRFSNISITPINIPSVISITPSRITFGPVNLPSIILFSEPNIPSRITFGKVNIPSVISFAKIPKIPSKISFGTVNIPSIISFGKANIPSIISFGKVNIPSIISFAKVPTFSKIQFAKPPKLSVIWGKPPKLSCTVNIKCPALSTTGVTGMLAQPFQDSFHEDGNNVELQTGVGVGIPSEIKIVAPVMPSMRLVHDIPSEIKLVTPNMPSEIRFILDKPIPSEIRITTEGVKLPESIALTHDLPKAILLDGKNIPKFIEIKMPKEFPSSILLDGSQIPSIIKVVGVPESIELKSNLPSQIEAILKAPENLEIPIVYKGGPIPMQLPSVIFGPALSSEEESKFPCFRLVPCNQ